MLLLIALGMATLSAAQTQSKNSAASTKWLFSYDDSRAYSAGTPDVRTDPRFHRLLVQNLHQQAFFWNQPAPVWKVAETFLGVGSGGLKVKEHRYAIIDGCVRHMCPDYEGFLWVDTDPKNDEVLFVALTAIPGEGINGTSPSLFHLWIFGNRNLRQDFVDNESLPDQFLYPMQDWIDKTGGRHVVSAMFVGPDGKLIPLLPRSLHLPDFQAATEVTAKEQQ